MCSVFGFCSSDGSYADMQDALRETQTRGPDASRLLNTGNGWLGFNRLSIMGLNENGMQPFVYMDKKTLPAGQLQDRRGLLLRCRLSDAQGGPAHLCRAA